MIWGFSFLRKSNRGLIDFQFHRICPLINNNNNCSCRFLRAVHSIVLLLLVLKKMVVVKFL